MLGIRSVCLTKTKKRGRPLFYERDGRETRIERIYNRVIFDELERRPDLHLPFRFQDDLDVVWVGHPNWYFRISKHSLPFLKTEHTAPAYFANEFPADEEIENYVLKPLYSFAGLGVEMEPTPDKLAALSNPREWILQKKVSYAEFVPTPDGSKSKAEIRMMFVWPGAGEPILVNNLVRMSQGKMMGVDFNKDKSWVGSSIALHSTRAACERLSPSSRRGVGPRSCLERADEWPRDAPPPSPRAIPGRRGPIARRPGGDPSNCALW